MCVVQCLPNGRIRIFPQRIQVHSQSSCDKKYKYIDICLKLKQISLLPAKRTGSWGMMVILDLSFPRPRIPMLTPSISMAPPADSMILKRARVSEDLPAPVLPTIPTFSMLSM